MKKKYKFTGDTIQHEGITLHRIKALRSFGMVRVGDIGGWIETEENLSHEGDCWVGGDAWVFELAHVYGHAQVFGHAQVRGSAWVSGHSQVLGSDWVSGHAHVMEDAEPSSDIHPEELKTLPESIEEVLRSEMRDIPETQLQIIQNGQGRFCSELGKSIEARNAEVLKAVMNLRRQRAELERERDEARKEWEEAWEGWKKALEERDEARRDLSRVRKELGSANRGAERNAHINNSLCSKLIQAERERDDALKGEV